MTRQGIMRKIFLATLFIVWFGVCGAIQIPEIENYILTEHPQQVLDTQGINDPIRDGAFWIVDSNGADEGSGELQGIIWPNDQIFDHNTAKNHTLQLIKNIVNYVLGFLALVALSYLIYNGFLIVTAWGDDTQYKKGIKSLQYAAIAIAWVGASWLIVSFIFWLIALITSP